MYYKLQNASLFATFGSKTAMNDAGEFLVGCKTLNYRRERVR